MDDMMAHVKKVGWGLMADTIMLNVRLHASPDFFCLAAGRLGVPLPARASCQAGLPQRTVDSKQKRDWEKLCS